MSFNFLVPNWTYLLVPFSMNLWESTHRIWEVGTKWSSKHTVANSAVEPCSLYMAWAATVCVSTTLTIGGAASWPAPCSELMKQESLTRHESLTGSLLCPCFYLLCSGGLCWQKDHMDVISLFCVWASFYPSITLTNANPSFAENTAEKSKCVGRCHVSEETRRPNTQHCLCLSFLFRSTFLCTCCFTTWWSQMGLFSLDQLLVCKLKPFPGNSYYAKWNNALVTCKTF